ncbi:cell division protein DamX [Erwinia sp. CPCC 100877]|nr:cell division protein DamX [Erwinia sp. CPCC 100877]
MDEFKPEDELKPDPRDRRSGRQRYGASHERDNEPSINVDDVDIDDDDVRPGRRREEMLDDEPQREAPRSSVDDDDEHRPRRRKAAPARTPASRQHIMMGVGVLVLLLVIIGIGSALKSPSSDDSGTAGNGGEKNIDLSASGVDSGNPQPENNGIAPQGGDTRNGSPQDISLPPVSRTPTQSQPQAVQQGQQRVEVQGDLNSALIGESQGNTTASVGSSTLPTQPATVASSGHSHHGTTNSTPQQSVPLPPAHRSEPHHERKKAVIEPPQRKATQPHASAPKSTTSTTKATSEPAKSATAQPAQKAVTASQPRQSSAPTITAAATSKVLSGNGSALQTAPSGHYTLQLSSSSNYNNLNDWAKKEKLQDYVVYQTVRNGKPWYVLVKGVYASKEAAKSAVASLPAGVQARNPWTKPVAQVQSDLKQ